MARLDWAQVGFAACMMVNLVDVMGMFFTAPVLIPYGQSLGASTSEIASFNTARFAMAIVSLLWMPKLADKQGTKLCVLISVLGTAVAYGVQGNAYLLSGCAKETYTLAANETMTLWTGHECQVLTGNVTLADASATAQSGGTLECTPSCGNKNGVYFMIFGQILAGFFGGTQPVLRGYIAKISLPNMQLLKLRSTMLFASMQAGNFALAPIAGVISQFGLFWPWYAATGTAVLVLLFVLLFFKNPQALQALAVVDAEKGEEKEKEKEKEPPYEGVSPVKDHILWLMWCGYICIFMCISALILLLPLLLEYDSFGLLVPGDVERSRERIASATSMVMIPHGVTNLVCSTVGFLIVSSYIGDRNTMRIGVTITSVCMALYGFASTQVWHMLLLHGFTGVGLGLTVPAITPTLQRYVGMAHSSKAAQASAMPIFGGQIGQVIGPLIFGQIVGDSRDRLRMNLAWLIAAVCMLTGVLLLDFSMVMVNRHPVMKRVNLTSEQLKIMLSTDAKDQDDFVEEMCQKLRGMLTPGHADYRGVRVFSGVAQRFLVRLLDRSIPKLREDPEEHIE
ncbi:unnamed protein product, partial [Effrenium voratum]